jgi:hypothetical protein
MGMEHLDLLRKLVALGEKKTGSAANQKAGALIRETVRGFGGQHLAVKNETFPLQTWSGTAQIHCPGFTLAARLLDYSGKEQQEVSGRLVSVRGGDRLSFFLNRTQDAIVVCRASLWVHRVLQVSRALAGGAVAVIIVSSQEDSWQEGIACPADGEFCPVPVLSITGNDWQRLRSVSDNRITISCDRTVNRTIGKNIIVDFQQDSQNAPLPRLVIGAHYDSWKGGAQDNCISVVMLLMLIRELGRLSLTANIRCIFFDGEELGLLGAKYHVANNDPEQYSCYLNLEMVVPSVHSRIKTLFISRKIPLRCLPLSIILKNLFLPLSLNLFYAWGNKSFPADVDPWYKRGIPCMTTYCDNRYFHTDEDRVDRIEHEQFPAVLAMLTDCIRGLAGYDFKKRKKRK